MDHLKQGDRVRVKDTCETAEFRGKHGTVTRLQPNLNVRLDGWMIAAKFLADEVEPFSKIPCPKTP